MGLANMAVEIAQRKRTRQREKKQLNRFLPLTESLYASQSKNPNFERIVNPEVNFPPFKNNNTQPEAPVLPPEVTPEDQDTVVASPNQPS